MSSLLGNPAFSVLNGLKPGASRLHFIVLVTLFSWARDEQTRQFGWWASSLARQDGQQFGSQLWKANRTKLLAKSLVQTRGYMEQALAYLTTQRIADAVEVKVERVGDRVHAVVAITRGDTQVFVEFADLWKEIFPDGS